MALSMPTVLAIYIVSQSLLLQIAVTEAEYLSPVSFELHGEDFVQIDGDAKYMGGNVFQLTNSTEGLGGGSAGRLVYNTTIPLWNALTKSSANFTTHFQFQTKWTRHDESIDLGDLGGDGLAFFLASPQSGFRVSYRGKGGWLGLFNPQNNGKSSNMLVAVEFDTYNSSDETNRTDIDDNHIGIDVNSINYEYCVPLAQRLNNSKIWDASIEYRGQENMLIVSARSEGKVLGHLSYPINFTKYLPANVVVGFSATAYQSSEIHQLISWKFTSVISGSFEKKKISWKLGVTVSSAILVAGLFVSFAICQYMRRNGETTDGIEEEQQSDMDVALEHVPRKFTYAELSSSTSGFNEQKRIGHGG